MASMKNLLPILLVASASASQFATSYNISDPTTACEVLKHKYPNITYLPEDAGYTEENQGNRPDDNVDMED